MKTTSYGINVYNHIISKEMMDAGDSDLLINSIFINHDNFEQHNNDSKIEANLNGTPTSHYIKDTDIIYISLFDPRVQEKFCDKVNCWNNMSSHIRKY